MFILGVMGGAISRFFPPVYQLGLGLKYKLKSIHFFEKIFSKELVVGRGVQFLGVDG